MKYLITILIQIYWALPGLAQQISFPAGIQCKVRPYYRYRPDGTPGRELMLKFTGGKFPGKAKVEIASGRIRETIETGEQVGDSLIVHGQPWVEFSNTVDKLPVMDKDGVHFGFGFDIPGSITSIDIPWSIMRLEDDQWPAANRAWMPHQHWVDISNDNSGVTWCSPDAALIESGSITANNTAGWDGKGDIWPSKLQQNSLIYSWVMNNHWYTNTPPTQEGPVTFRYMIKPHDGYDAAEANRFGLEQMQPLVHVLCDKNPMEKPLFSIDNNRLSVNILKSAENGSSMIVRVRSLSSTDEILDLKWPEMKPAKVFLCDRGEEAGGMEVADGITVPANGFVTLKVVW